MTDTDKSAEVTQADIVERLRTYRSAGVRFARLTICDEAADTITDMMGALEAIRAGYPKNSNAYKIASQAIARARGTS